MKRNKILAVILAAATLLTLCACAAEPSTDATQDTTLAATQPPIASAVSKEVTDMVGRTISIDPSGYRRIVCIGAGALRMYCYIGDVSLLCGVEDIDNDTLSDRPQMFDGVARPYVLAYGDTFRTLPSCGVGGPNAQTAEAEKILACAPDLVISEYEDRDKADALAEQLGVPVVTLATGADGVFDDAFAASLRLLGKVLGREARAEQLINYVDDQISDLMNRTANLTADERPGVYLCGLGNWGTTNHLMTVADYAPFKITGIRNVVNGLAATGVQAIESETFAALGEEIDIMILDAAAVKNIAPLYREDPTMFDTCKAWREGEVYLEMAYNAYYTNFEIALINTWYAATVTYPDRFADVDITEKANEITEHFLGQALADEIFACPTSFGGYQKLDTAAFFS